MFSEKGKTRRAVLSAMASVLGSSILWPLVARGDDEISLDWPDDTKVAVGVLQITLRLPEGREFPTETKVCLKVSDHWEEMTGVSPNHTYEKQLQTGKSYSFRVTSPGYRTIERTVVVARARVAALDYLVPEEWPFYLVGGVTMPVKPRPRLAGVAFGRPIGSEITTLTERADTLGYRRITKDPETGVKLDDVYGSVLYFEPTDLNALFFSFEKVELVSPVAVEQLRNLFAAYQPRVGALVEVQKGRVRILDGQYLIRFPNPVTQIDVQKFAGDLGAIVVRLSDPKAGFWLIEFADSQNLRRHLDVIAEQVELGYLTSGEPNLLFQLSNYSGLTATTNDPWEYCQVHLERQRVYDAWRYIEQHVPNVNRYGSPVVRVATLDDGITYNSATSLSSHPDVDPARVGYCYDLFADGPCTGVAPSSPHGMGSYGIISAKPDNGHNIKGIAPNVTHIPVAHASIWSFELYAQSLLWIGGVRLSAPDGINNATCPIPPADIISCSHSFGGVNVVPDNIDSALKQLTCMGRGGLGTVLIYSAGNEDRPMLADNELATHPHTIGVGDTQIAGGAEVRWENLAGAFPEGSNYSDWLSLCANGEGALTGGGAPSLLPDRSDGSWSCNGASPDPGVFLYGGTSAAAPMVAAAAALVLSVNPRLNWLQVRAVLCASAEKIDCGNNNADGKWVWRGPNFAASRSNPCTRLPPGLNWFSKWYGYGRLNVYRAVKVAHTATPKPPPTCDAF